MVNLVKLLTKFIEVLKGCQITIRQSLNLRFKINIKTKKFDNHC